MSETGLCITVSTRFKTARCRLFTAVRKHILRRDEMDGGKTVVTGDTTDISSPEFGAFKREEHQPLNLALCSWAPSFLSDLPGIEQSFFVVYILVPTPRRM